MSTSTVLTGAKRTALKALTADQREFFDERAAILEYEAGASRLDAELRALDLTYQWFSLRACPQDAADFSSRNARSRSDDDREEH
jgi:hypothetical protein